MKKLIFIFISLISFSQAQTIQYIGAPTTTVVSRGNFRSDSIFYLPKRTKIPTDTAAFRYQISDSSLYYWTGYQWTKVQSASSFASVDTTIISTRAYRQKGIDSVQYNVGLKVNIADTASMLSPYLLGSGTSNYFPKFNASRSVINSKLYESNLNLLFNSTTPYITTSGISTIENNGTSASVYVLKTQDTARAYVSFGGSNTMDINNLRAGDIRFYTNATLRGRFQTDGTFRLNSLTGTGSRIVVADDNGVLSASSSATGFVDTTILSTRAYRQKGDDSLGAIIATKGSGTVTSIATGYGLSGGTITTTGTLIADTLNLSTRAWRQKGVDSVMNETSLRISGSGTLNNIAKFSATRILTNSSLFDNGSQVQSTAYFIVNPTSAGNSFMQFKYSGTDVGIIGTDASISGGSAGDFGIYTYGSNNLDFWTNNTRRSRINASGELLINTTTDAGAYTLQNNGALYNSGDISIRGTYSPVSATNRGNITLNGTASNIIAFANNSALRGYIFHTDSDFLFYNNTTGGRVGLYTEGTARLWIAANGNVGIGTTSPSASALLDLSSTTRGFLPPRMTSTERDAISSPAAGLVIYNTTTSKLQVYTTSWTDLH